MGVAAMVRVGVAGCRRSGSRVRTNVQRAPRVDDWSARRGTRRPGQGAGTARGTEPRVRSRSLPPVAGETRVCGRDPSTRGWDSARVGFRRAERVPSAF